MQSNKEKSTSELPFGNAPSLCSCGQVSTLGIHEHNTVYSNCQVLSINNKPASLLNEENEIVQKFTPKKQNGQLLSDSYKRLGFDKKASRVADCGTLLEFAHEMFSDGSFASDGKLHKANFCRDRLCPMCAWRRSYKIYGQASQIMDAIGKQYEFLFLTLTVPSVQPTELSETITRLTNSWHKLMMLRPVKKSVLGFFRALEITRNNNPYSKSFGLYHPHFHCILAVSKSYFKQKYISQNEWLNMWRSSYGDESITQVDIRRAKDKHISDDISASDTSASLGSAVAEIAKYAVKSSDYLFDDYSQTDDIVSCLSLALRGRRLTAFGGVFKDTLQALNLDDCEDGDLVHLDEKLNSALTWLIVRYGWSAGCYKMLDTYIEGVNAHV